MMRKTEQQWREEIVEFGRKMYQKGYIGSVEGNLSVRLAANRILITPSGLNKGFMRADQMVVVDLDGRQIGSYGAGRQLKPTSELPMHLEAYRRRDDISAVIHAHPPRAVTLSIAGIPIADCLIPEVIVLLGTIPTTPYATPSSAENAVAIRSVIGWHDAIMLERHGSLTVGRDLWEAFNRLETLERSADIGLSLAQMGVQNRLPAHEIDKLLAQRRRLGLARPGEAERFCDLCGVCHTGGDHAHTVRFRSHSPAVPPSRSDAARADELRHSVNLAIERTLGNQP
jgi:L-fuculose-phosphate aldolase